MLSMSFSDRKTTTLASVLCWVGKVASAKLGDRFGIKHYVPSKFLSLCSLLTTSALLPPSLFLLLSAVL